MDLVSGCLKAERPQETLRGDSINDLLDKSGCVNADAVVFRSVRRLDGLFGFGGSWRLMGLSHYLLVAWSLLLLIPSQTGFI